MSKIYFCLILCSLSLCLHASTCPSGWMRNENSCYFFSQDHEDWPTAMTMCHILGGKFVEIESAAEGTFLASMAMRFDKNYWIGLSDIQQEGVWIWMETKTPMSQTGYLNWHPDQPNNYDHKQNCATLNGNNYYGQWNDWHCSASNLPFICEKPDGLPEIVG
ncbi:perlucin-like protein [Ruditapes philippinarum]|uniref:perlucin-like protein n=1 Tax=Ruditapes philippinarum TaxID=129788 RepID=UPI00295B909C|nr:perlucin-like protein [Ruditapes philippinarum]